MKKAILVLFLGLALAAGARAQTIGPITNGPYQLPLLGTKPITYSNGFNGTGPSLIRVTLSAPNILTTGTLVLNGTQIMQLSDFANGVTQVDRFVTLIGQNTFSFTVAGTRGQTVTLTVYQVIMPTPGSLTPNPLALTLGANGTLTATLSPTPTAAGTLAVSSSNTAVATVPSSIAFASGQASVPIPVTTVGSGSTTITASANGGQATATVTVNAPPTVSITSPASGATFDAPANITIAAAASDGDGTIAKVDFYQGATLLGTSTAAPYAFSWANVAVGSYSLTAVATDDRGAATTSSAVPITVRIATTVQSLTPATLSLTPGASGTLTVSIASAQISDTTVAVATSDPAVATVPSSVVVPSGSTSAPFAVSAVAAGTAQVTATLGASSAASTVQVVAPPVISGETPKDVTLAGGATPEVAASYSSPGSSIDPASVRLQLDGTDVTSAATVAASGVLYLVTRPLADATHTVSLTVGDVLGGTTTRTWSFVVDDPAPNFYNETPRGISLVDRNPRIRVLLSGFGIVPTSVHISLDGSDVTAQADAGVDHIVYTPATALGDGLHTVSVSATDGRGATGSKQWTFTITTPPPPPTTTDGVRTGRTVTPTIRVLP